MTDILERLKNSSQINGAYPRDIEDAIKEIEALRQMLRYSQQQSAMHFDMYQEADREIENMMQHMEGVRC